MLNNVFHPKATSRSSEEAIFKKKRGPRILCLDGGGIRGIIELIILDRLEQITQKPVIRLFDLICGTSTGGLIALLIWKGVRVSSLLEIYREMGSEVFSRGLSQSTSASQLSKLLSKGYLYDAQMLENVLQNLCGDDRLTNGWNTPKVFVTTTPAHESRPKPFLLRSYVLRGEEPYEGTTECSLVQAGLATSAAPYYFDVVQVNVGDDVKMTFKDGGVVANNPTKIAIEEAKAIWGVDPELVVSIGTGIPTNKNEPKQKPIEKLIQNFKQLVHVATSSENIAEDVQKNVNGRFVYIRLNPKDLGDYALDGVETEVIAGLTRKTIEYLDVDAKEIVQNLARFFLNNPN